MLAILLSSAALTGEAAMTRAVPKAMAREAEVIVFFIGISFSWVDKPASKKHVRLFFQALLSGFLKIRTAYKTSVQN
jgi:hypothetical protein